MVRQGGAEDGRDDGRRPPVHPYPVVLVHGIAAHDRGIHGSPLWGRVPEVLRSRGFSVFFGDTDAWGSVESNGAALARTVDEVLAETGASQVILIAHSKGGLDVRSALLEPGVAAKVRGVVTLSSPHRGMEFCTMLARSRFLLPHVVSHDVRSALLEPGVAAKVRGVVTLSSPHRGMEFCTMLARSRFLLPHVVSHLVDGWSRLRGDRNPDSIQALRDLTKGGARDLVASEADGGGPEGAAAVPFRSYGFRSAGRRYPRSHMEYMVRRLDGENDGLVPLGATAHGDHGVMLAEGRIDHDDCTDRSGRDFTLVAADGSVYRSPAEFIAAVVGELEEGPAVA